VINLFKRRKILITHNSGFHADDVFACAILQIYLESRGEKYKIIRTRDMKTIETGDFVFDVGGIYDADKDRFDHHQLGRAGKRENGIYYAACGLVWKKFGESLCGSQEIASYLDKKVFQALDAPDNGQDLVKNIFPEVLPYSMPAVVGVFNNSWLEQDKDENLQFNRIVTIAKEIIKREISQALSYFKAELEITQTYEKSLDKAVIVLESPYNRSDILKVLTKYPEPVYFVYPRAKNAGWKLECVRKSFGTFEQRKPLPKAWAGLHGSEFIKASGVSDALFCHNGLFLAQAQSKNGALELAKKAINS
jgi:uncharacterized UPF0160 family protein